MIRGTCEIDMLDGPVIGLFTGPARIDGLHILRDELTTFFFYTSCFQSLLVELTIRSVDHGRRHDDKEAYFELATVAGVTNREELSSPLILGKSNRVV